MFELSGDFGYDKQIFGATRNNFIVSRSYSGGVSIYLFDLTAIDLNISQSIDTTTTSDVFDISGTTYQQTARQDRVETNIYGAGIKQMLAPRNSFLVPMIGAGYARETIYSDFDVTYKNTSNSSYIQYVSPKIKQEYNSVYGTFILQLKLTERLSLKGAVKTLFPAFEFNKAKDNLKYSLGFSWIF